MTLSQPRERYSVLPVSIAADGQIARSYPGAPGFSGWAIFLENDDCPRQAQPGYTGSPIFEREGDAISVVKAQYDKFYNPYS